VPILSFYMKYFLSLATALAGSLLLLNSPSKAIELVGRAVLPADTFASGPTSGQFITDDTNGRTVPFLSQDAVQGFSSILTGPKAGTFLMMKDNGFGNKANSPDALLRVYGVRPDFKTRSGGSGQVFPINIGSGKTLSSFSGKSILELSDPNRQSGFNTISSQTVYPGSAIAVASQITSQRLLTGGDYDLESFRRVPDGTYWFGEEFGPFLLHTSANGVLLEPPIPVPNFLGFGGAALIQSLDNPFLGTNTPNLARSRGLEGLALNASGTKLYAMLEGPNLFDLENPSRLLIHEFDIATKKFTGQVFSYRMENTTGSGQSIGDLTAINDSEFLVLERDSLQGDPNNPLFTNPARFKRLYRININRLDSQGFVQKELLADLLNIPDPNNLGGNGTTNGVFTFPFFTIESVLLVNPTTVLIVNDNNYPFRLYSEGRTPGQLDNNEFIQIRLDISL
jgi:hypothetical protein